MQRVGSRDSSYHGELLKARVGSWHRGCDINVLSIFPGTGAEGKLPVLTLFSWCSCPLAGQTQVQIIRASQKECSETISICALEWSWQPVAISTHMTYTHSGQSHCSYLQWLYSLHKLPVCHGSIMSVLPVIIFGIQASTAASFCRLVYLREEGKDT
jgi:hypothetical protein